MSKENNKDLQSKFNTHTTYAKSHHVADEAKKSAAYLQQPSEAYRLAFDDSDFLLQNEQRAVRLMLEWQKPDQILDQFNIVATWPIFGSARIRSLESLKDERQALNNRIDHNPQDKLAITQLNQLDRLLDKTQYYDECMKLAALLSDPANTGVLGTVVTGGGPGIMEAANRGAAQAGAKSIGLNIVLPTEQTPNPYISPEFCFQFQYFAVRKMHFLMRAKALFAFPGGYGTLDELMETLTLLQTGRTKPMPIFLFGESFWNKIIDLKSLVDEGMITERDLSLFTFVDTAEQAIKGVKDYYGHIAG